MVLTCPAPKFEPSFFVRESHGVTHKDYVNDDE
jgi:hypothetical protein